MTAVPPALPRPPASERRVWIGYGGACFAAWLFYVLAGTELQRGPWEIWVAAYNATMSLVVPMLLGIGVYPWVRRLQRMNLATAPTLVLHGAAGLVFGGAWLIGEVALARVLFGADHASAMLQQSLLWRLIWGMVVYDAIATGFTAMLQTRLARAAALAAAQSESALARAELAAISGKLNPHFLFNTLNSLIALTRKDPQAAEAALLRFSGMLRYVLDSKRSSADRVPLADEIAFVRDYLALESLRLGTRLRVDWQLDPATLQDEIPPLSLQPLVENSVQHGAAPRVEGARIRIRSERDAAEQGLSLVVEDDGPGCDPARLADDTPGTRRGIGLDALRRRFALDYDGRARFDVRTAPGAGFRVDLWIPQAA